MQKFVDTVQRKFQTYWLPNRFLRIVVVVAFVVDDGDGDGIGDGDDVIITEFTEPKRISSLKPKPHL